MIVIIDYGAGNIGSIINMIKRIGYQALQSSDPEVIKNAEKLILPGVGAFDLGMSKLKESGLIDLLNDLVLNQKKPILGICLGVQLMTKGSEEGNIAGLGWFNAFTKKFDFGENPKNFKIPHMGWNTTFVKKNSCLFEDNDESLRYYHVHSYHLVAENQNDVLTSAKYGYEFVTGLQSENIYGVQYHPEKSHKYGMKLLKNFIELV